MNFTNKMMFDYGKILSGFVDLIKKILWVIARDAFLFILIFILSAIVLGEVLFYNYVFLVQVSEPTTSDSLVIFREDALKNVIVNRKEGESAFNSPFGSNYINPFK